VWDAPREDTEWVFSVNLWGSLNGVQAFVPRMLDRGTPAYVVNTASIAAFSPQPGAASYMMSKSAVVSLSETLLMDLRALDAPIGVAVVLPEHFRSRLGSAHRNRSTADDAPGTTWEPIWSEEDYPMLATGADPRIVGQRVVEAVRNDLFWVLPPRTDAMSVVAIDRLHAIERSFLEG
jgi:NAD(P)-dependent dehydrogenase (short-subunit alcohol dehydrogenase family)